MIAVRKSQERGHANYGWLDTYHTFSFADYYDPKHVHFRSLRVMNEDRVAPGQGFGEHPHRDMEIVTYILEGALQHKDSMGNGSIIRPGDFQRMTAGTGVTHSEFNPSTTEPIHLYQIWIIPSEHNLKPGYEERSFSKEDKHNRLRLVASNDGRDSSLTIHQDASIYLGDLEKGRETYHAIAAGRHAWLQVLRGAVRLDGGQELSSGDAAAFSGEEQVKVIPLENSEVMLFDLA